MSVVRAQRVSLALGAVYALLGGLGFIPAVVYPADVPGPGLVFGTFAVDPVLNLVHLVLGGLLFFAGLDRARWDAFAKPVAWVFVVLVIGSLFAPIGEVVAINRADTMLHTVTAIVLGFLAYPRGWRR